MTPTEFAEKWNGSPIVQYRLTSPAAEGLPPAATSALREVGLPEHAEPWLTFREYDAADAQAYYPVGHLANGSLICVEKVTGRLLIIDRDDPDEIWQLNSSLEALYESLVIYNVFIDEVNKRNPRFAADYRIPEGMLGELKRKLTACDPEAMEAKGYWYCEIKVLDDGTL